MEDKKERSRFFEEILPLADITIDIAINISFFTLSNVEIDFMGYYIYWKIYIFVEIFPTTRRVELIEKKRFTAAAFDLEDDVFIVYMAFICQNLDIHLLYRAQMALLKANEAVTCVSPKYADFANIVSKDLAAKQPEYSKINGHSINLIKRQ